MYLFWIAVLFGVVEGLTEFLPISSTGHLIVAGELAGFKKERSDVFVVFIQLGAILAVVWQYRERLLGVARDLPRKPAARRFTLHLFVAFLPAALIGVVGYPYIQKYLFSTGTVAAALIAGALLILLVESLHLEVKTYDAQAISRRQAWLIGGFQCLALWPGFSRSAATILGGLCVGLNRRAATEFSFFLAIPTMFGATIYNLLNSYHLLAPGDAAWLALSFAISFVVAWRTIRWLLHYVSTHTFVAFAWYRLALGFVILTLLVWNGVD